MDEYRLVEQEYNDGRVFYIVEKSDADEYGITTWNSVFRSQDVNKARDVLNERRAKVIKWKVIE